MKPSPRIRDVARVLLPGVFLCGSLVLSAAAARADDVPKLAGNWTWSWKDQSGTTHRHVLEVEGVGTKLAARERFDDQPAVRVADLKLEGKKVRFTIVRGQRRADYTGVVADDVSAIEGTVTVTTDGQSDQFEWKALREPRKAPAQETPEPTLDGE